MERVIVTGANGFIGRNLVSNLTERGIKVTALDIIFGDELNCNNLVTCINCKDRSMEELFELLKNTTYDCFFHLAWKGVYGIDKIDYISQLDNIKNTCDFVCLSKKLACTRFMYASSINEMETYEYLQSDDIEPTGGYIYGAGKIAGHFMAETLAFQNNIDFIPVIITNTYGVGEKSSRLINSSIRKLINNEHCSFTSGHQTYDFIYITDAINSVIEVALKGKAFNRYYIGSGEPKPLKDFIIEMKNVVNPTAEIGLGDIPFKGVNINYDQFKLKKVLKDTGYVNKISFKDGIKLTMDYILHEDKQKD